MTDLRIIDAPLLQQEQITDTVVVPTGGAGNYSLALSDLAWYIVQGNSLATVPYVDQRIATLNTDLQNHISDYNNPHQVTKAQVGLSNVDNTADLDKPVSNATQSAIITAVDGLATNAYVDSAVALKADKTYVDSQDALKADKATTLSGYGITDAYNKPDVDTRIANKTVNSLSIDSNDVLSVRLTDNTTKSVDLTSIFDNGVAKGIDDGAVRVQQPFTSAVARTQHDKNIEFVSLKDFGAKGDGVSDDTQNLKNFINHVLKTGVAGYIPQGTYLISDKIEFDMGGYEKSRTGGFRVYGDGIRRSVLKSTFATDTAFRICNNNQSNKACFYPEIEMLGFESSAPFPTFAIGKHDFSDEVNAIKINVHAANSDTTVGACAIEINGVYQGVMNVTANTGGTSTLGDSLRLRQAQFLQITGSGGNSSNSIHITGGYSFGNVILNWDAEEVKYCIVIDVSTATSNTFVGGQFVWSVACINATAGNNNFIINPNFGLSVNQVVATTGISIIGQGKSYGTAYSPSTTFRNDDFGNTDVKLDAKTAYAPQITWSYEGVDKYKIDLSGDNLVFRRYTGTSWDDVGYINPAATFNINNLNTLSFGLSTSPKLRQVVTGSRGGNQAVESILNALANFGLITDNTTA